jgi:enoyl-CoA hydratase/carnithine racemase
MPDQLVKYACSDHIATIALNRPDKLNAVNDDMVRQIAAALPMPMLLMRIALIPPA